MLAYTNNPYKTRCSSPTYNPTTQPGVPWSVAQGVDLISFHQMFTCISSRIMEMLVKSHGTSIYLRGNPCQISCYQGLVFAIRVAEAKGHPFKATADCMFDACSWCFCVGTFCGEELSDTTTLRQYTPQLFNMVHLKLSPWKRRFLLENIGFSGSMLNLGGRSRNLQLFFRKNSFPDDRKHTSSPVDEMLWLVPEQIEYMMISTSISL